MIRIKEADSQDKDTLNYILQNSEYATIFHTQEWNELLSKEFNLKSKTFIAWKNGIPAGMHTVFVSPAYSIIHTGYNSPWLKTIESSLRNADSVYGGPIFTEMDQGTQYMEHPALAVIVPLLVKAGERIAKKVEYSQICTPPGYPINLIQKCGYKCQKHLTSVVKVNKSEEELWNSLHGTKRNRVRKAMKNGIKIVMDDFSFIDIYCQMVSQTFGKAGKSCFPFSYYKHLIQRLVPQNLARFLIARYKGKVVAGAIFLCFKDTVYFWSGASFQEYNWLAPNVLIHWEIIKWAHRNWYKYYDWLVLDPEHLPEIARFKIGFGGETKEIYSARKYTRFGNLAKYTRALLHIKHQIAKCKITN